MADPKREPPTIPSRPGTSSDPLDPHEVENPGDPGPPVLVPSPVQDPRHDPRIPPQPSEPEPGA